MGRDARAAALAELAAALAAGAGVVLPHRLALWRLGGRPTTVAPLRAADPEVDLGAALEAALTPRERRRGAHFTPAPVADEVARLALDGARRRARPTVADPACGAGALLLAAGRHLVRAGVPRDVVARDLLWGADLDPLAAAVTEAAVALWSGGVAPAPGHVVAGDPLYDGLAAWPSPPTGGFGAVAGNPPFQAQLARSTARSRAAARRLRARFGDAVAPYVDTAALFLLAAVELVRPGGRVALVQPQSVAAARDAAPVRGALAERARLVELWVPAGAVFDARVHVCVPVLEVGADGNDGPADWAGRLARALGTPELVLAGPGRVGDLATAAAPFRDEYYALARHVREATTECSPAPLVTSGLVDPGAMRWGAVPVRFAKRTWARPEIDVAALVAAEPAPVAARIERVRRPKVVVASQTRVVEAAADPTGRWVPATPVVSVLPHDPGDVERLAAVLCAPPVSAWALARTAGAALSSGSLRLPASLLLDVPLPADETAWCAATDHLAAGELAAYAVAATEMYRLPQAEADAVLAWWGARAKPTWPTTPPLR